MMKRRGFSLLETVMGLMVMGVGVTSLWALVGGNQQRTMDEMLSTQLSLVAKAAQTYIDSNRVTLAADAAITTAGHEIRIRNADSGLAGYPSLVGSGLLPPSFTNQTPYAQTYHFYIQRQEAGVSGTLADDNIIGLVVTEDGSTGDLTELRLSQIASRVGGGGGVIGAAATTIDGSFGGWQMSCADWAAAYTCQPQQLAVLTRLLGRGGGGSGGGGGTALDDLSDGRTVYAETSLFAGDSAGVAYTSSTGLNTGAGYQALTALTSGSNNTALGAYSIGASTTQSYNVGVGPSSMRYISSDYGVGIGAETLKGSIIWPANSPRAVAIGYFSQNSCAADADIVSVGYGSANSVQASSSSVFVGALSGANPTSVNRTVTVGARAAPSLAIDNDVVAIGSNAAYYLNPPCCAAPSTKDVAIGYYAMRGTAASVTGIGNTAIAWQALTAITTGVSNTAIGAYALRRVTTGGYNTAIGYNAGAAVSDGTYNVAIGASSLYAAAARTLLHYNVAIGDTAMGQVTNSSQNNLAVGWGALPQGGNRQTAIGMSALGWAVGGSTDNVAVGYFAGQTIYYAAGSLNVAIGSEAMNSPLGTAAPNSNVAIGYKAASGYAWGTYNFTYNVAIGSYALASETGTTAGGGNIAIGYRAANPDGTGSGVAQTDGQKNIIIGNNLGLPTATTSNYMNIGGLIRADLVNRRVVIGGTGSELPSTTHALSVQGTTEAASYTVSSDRNLKRDIHELSDVLSNVLALRPVTFNWRADGKPGMGFIAQEVAALFPALVKGEEGRMSVDYCGLVSPATAAVQEQQFEIEALSARRQILRDRLARLPSADVLQARVDRLDRAGQGH